MWKLFLKILVVPLVQFPERLVSRKTRCTRPGHKNHVVQRPHRRHQRLLDFAVPHGLQLFPEVHRPLVRQVEGIGGQFFPARVIWFAAQQFEFFQMSHNWANL